MASNFWNSPATWKLLSLGFENSRAVYGLFGVNGSVMKGRYNECVDMLIAKGKPDDTVAEFDTDGNLNSGSNNRVKSYVGG